MQWYYLKRGDWIGPISDDEKRDLMNHGVYPCSVLKWSNDFAESEDEEVYDNSNKEKYIEEDGEYCLEEEEEGEEEVVDQEDIGEEEIEDSEMYADWKEIKEKGGKEVEEGIVSEEEGDEDEDVLAVTDDEFWNLDEFIKEEYSTEDDDLAVHNSYYGDADLEDEVAGDDSNDLDEANNWNKSDTLDEINKTNGTEKLNRSCEQNNSTPSSDVPIERLKALEEGLEQVKQVVVSLYSRLNYLEKKTDEFGKNFEILDADVKSLLIKNTENTKDWIFRFNDQAERVAIVQEKITGIQRKINGEIGEKNRRLVDLEEKTGNYETTNQVIVTNINSLLGDVSSCKHLIDGQKTNLMLTSMRLGEVEEIVNDVKRFVNSNVQRQEFVKITEVVNDLKRLINVNVQRQEFVELAETINDLRRLVNTNAHRLDLAEQEIGSVSDSIQESITTSVCRRISQLETTLQNLREARINFEQIYTLEQIQRADELQKIEQRIKNIVENYIQFQAEQISNHTETTVLTERLEEIQNRFRELEESIESVNDIQERHMLEHTQSLSTLVDSKITDIVERLLSKQRSVDQRLDNFETQISTKNDIKAVLFASIIVFMVAGVFLCILYFPHFFI